MRTALVLLALSLAADAFTTSQRIVGGTLTTIDQYPSIAALLHSSDGSSYWHSCGGIIINNRSILTAAHCLIFSPVGTWRGRVGSTFSNSGGVVHAFTDHILHPSYNMWTHDGDIAIAHTATTIVYVNNAVAAASIAGTNYIPADNQLTWAAGWGYTSFGGQQSPQLRHVDVLTINQAVCRERYSYLTDNMLCAGWLDIGGKDACTTDSGGPLYHNGVVVGVTSFGTECALPRYPGVYARVSRYTPWIQANA